MALSQMKNKPTRMNKGLSDKELIAKYESGKTPMRKVISKMLRPAKSGQFKNLKKR